MERTSSSVMSATTRITLLALLLNACGGGGGGGSSTPPPPNLNSAPGAAAINAFFQASHSATLNAGDTAGNKYQVQLSWVPNAGTTTFNGTANAHSTVRAVSVFVNGALNSNDISTEYFLLNPYVPIGAQHTSGTTDISANIQPVPATITVGQSGPIDTVTVYHNATLITVDALETNTFSVLANNPTTLLFCQNSVLSNVTAQGTADGFVADTESDCYAVDASGNANIARIILSLNGGVTTLTFQ